jgi:hypothetical protein
MKHSITIIIVLFLSLSCWAGVKNQSIAINGTTAHKRVVEISYDDDANVMLKWSDNTYTHSLLAQTITEIACKNCLDKANIISVSGLYGDKITISGLISGETVNLFDIQGNKIISQQATGQTVEFNLSRLNTGIYLLQQDNNLIKFVKQ